MRLTFRLAATALMGLALLAAGWGVWLLVTQDYQGGRALAGGLTLIVAVALGWVGITLLILSTRRRRI
jgi:hypothetical protein